MVLDEKEAAGRNVEQLFGLPDPAPVSDELQKLTDMLAPLCPKDCIIRFEFDGKLRLHIDVRRFEEIAALEALLPAMWGGIFYDVQRGIAEKHSFFHRLTAVVRR
jgi:hypothetical protein